MTAQQDPRYAYEDPAALAWGAQMVREWGKRKRLRLAAENARQDTAPEPDDRESGGGS